MGKRETFSQENRAGLDVIQVAKTTIVLPFDKATYAGFVDDTLLYTACVNDWMNAYPELCPDTISGGWSLYGVTKDSVKQGIRVRRIVTTAAGEVWQIRPAFVMPSMTCETATAETILL